MFIASKNYLHKFAKCFSPYKCHTQVRQYKNIHKGRQYQNERSLFLTNTDNINFEKIWCLVQCLLKSFKVQQY